MKLTVIAALLLAAAPALAGPAADAFRAGRFADAATAGRAEATADSLVIAGRSTGTVAAFQTADKARAKALLQTAVADFDAALKRDPGNADAILQRGIVIGYIAKIERSPGGAKDARRAFESVLARRPGDATALAAMGGWHGESVATLGSFLASTVLGAHQKDSLRFYERAVAADPASAVHPTFYASTLLGLDAGNAAKARALLDRADKATPRDGFESLMQRHAREILAPLARGDVKAAQAVAKRLGALGTAG
jgi:tetratricopeptide (TPR) repeat protein